MARRRRRRKSKGGGRRKFRLKFRLKPTKALTVGAVLAFLFLCFFFSKYMEHRRTLHMPKEYRQGAPKYIQERVRVRQQQKAQRPPAQNLWNRMSAPFTPKKTLPSAAPSAESQSFRERLARIKSEYSSGKPKIVFVIDDIGHTQEHLSELKQLGPDVVYAILPFLKHTGYFDQLSRQTGAEVILHLPMESVNGTIPGPGLLTSGMNDREVQELVSRNLATVPHAVGANNHMGSRGTADPRIMSVALKELRARKMLFLDSMTTQKTVTRDIAGPLGYTTLKRDIFLDNVDEKGAVREKVRQLAEVARARGYAVGIGHYRHNTLAVLLEEIPRLKREGFEIANLRELVRLKESR